MKIIDLSQPLYDHMPVYPGDPDVIIKRIFSFEKDGWNMNRIEMNSHDGTHVNIPIHGTKSGRNLDSYSIENFIGEAVIFNNKNDIIPRYGIIFSIINITRDIAEIIVKKKPRFVGLSKKLTFDEEVERYLLKNGVISYENLINTEKLPRKFIFYGVPLRIKEGDGSPVRAFAVIK